MSKYNEKKKHTYISYYIYGLEKLVLSYRFFHYIFFHYILTFDKREFIIDV